MLVKELCGPSVPGTTHSADLVASFNVLLSPQRGSRLQSAAPFAVFVPATPGLWRHLAGLKVSLLFQSSVLALEELACKIAATSAMPST